MFLNKKNIVRILGVIMYWYISIFGFFFVAYVFIKVRNKLFSEMKSFLWISAGFITLVIIPLYPKLITIAAKILKIEYPPSVIFLFGILFILVIVFKQEQDIFLSREMIKELTQKNAIIDEKIRRLQNVNDLKENNKRLGNY